MHSDINVQREVALYTLSWKSLSRATGVKLPQLWYLEMLETVQQNVQIKSRNIVAGVDVRIKLVQLGQQKGQEAPLAALQGEDAAPIGLPGWSGILRIHLILKACTN